MLSVRTINSNPNPSSRSLLLASTIFRSIHMIREPAGPAHSAGKPQAVASAHPGGLEERGVAGKLQTGVVGELEPVGRRQRRAGPAGRRTRVRSGGIVRRPGGACMRQQFLYAN